jgi:hypothetical protein
MAERWTGVRRVEQHSAALHGVEPKARSTGVEHEDDPTIVVESIASGAGHHRHVSAGA